MPHLVANFLRSSSGNIKKTATSRSSRTSRNNSVSASPYASDSEDHHALHPVRMPEPGPGDALKKRRLSLPFGRSRHDGHGHGHAGNPSHSPTSASSSASMDWRIESPPVVLHGSPEESTGALVSGLLYVRVGEEALEVDGLVATLSVHVTHKKPFQGHCAECQTQVTELKSWRFLGQSTCLRRGNHQFPFSTLLAGNLPASVNTPVISISYHFKAEAVAAVAAVPSPTSTSSLSLSPLKLDRILDVKRSLPEPLYPRHSVRVFPPTNIKASAHYTSVIHPTGSNRITLKLDGLMNHNDKVKTVDLWKLRKVTWKLEETIRTLAPACDKHALPSSTRGIPRTETRLLGEEQMHEGWKSDYTGSDGIVDLEFDYAMTPQPKTHATDPDFAFACDVQTDDGTDVSHALHVELIVSKEFAPEGKPHLAAQTGTGRILRMHFAVSMTEYPGLGVSWDNEAPPVYQDVPPSPPGYPSEPPIEYGHLEELLAQRQGSASESGSRRPSASGRSP
ncbi:hypothetical protein C2857_000989 [Epichloe festucae Fl1]|uniref:LDB19 N-terminal domain-containing protein n=1 Tax=Epichloe festucae (strain Fl1) TaxID=877507 RepID=A0A7S9KN55_EPIFF|nr:hypothetical protein C2857_000989 [Epichloe festucae Fl1]